MSTDFDAARYSHGKLHARVILVVIVVSILLHVAVFAARIVVPDRADRHVTARLDNLVVDVIHFAPIRPLLGNQMNHVVRARRELYGAIQVEDVHPTPGIDSTVPAPYIGVAPVLLLRTDGGRSEQQGENRQ